MSTKPSLPRAIPIAPTEAEWHAMSPAERERFLVEVHRFTTETRNRATIAERATARAKQAIAGLRAGILAALETRGISIPDDLRARVVACDDPAALQRWLLKALSAATSAEVFSTEPDK